MPHPGDKALGNPIFGGVASQPMAVGLELDVHLKFQQALEPEDPHSPRGRSMVGEGKKILLESSPALPCHVHLHCMV